MRRTCQDDRSCVANIAAPEKKIETSVEVNIHGENTMGVDDTLDALGTYGRYQMLTFCLVGMVSAVAGTWQLFIIVFIGRSVSLDSCIFFKVGMSVWLAVCF